MSKSITDMRREYTRGGLREADVSADPIRQFRTWLEHALATETQDANAMTLATVDAGGEPHARVVLLKDVDGDDFVFYTNYRSAKGAELAATSSAELVFFWSILERQVRVHGAVTTVSSEQSDAYFRTRPRRSQLAAWASAQSEIIANREALEGAMRDVEARFGGGEISRPPHWGGYRLAPAWIEFWQGRPDRLHDRLRYVRASDGWRMERLAP